MNRVYDSVLGAVGSTPIVKLQSFSKPGGHTFWGKLEFMNPGGSIKDRIGVALVEKAEKKGDLKPGSTIIEATSGNTGLGLAMAAAIKGYKCVFVMPDKVSEEKRAILRAYGAEVVITPSGTNPDDPTNYLNVQKRLLAETPGSFNSNQYHNQDNPVCHYETTGPEIWEQMGSKLDYFVGGAGTGGTVSGVGRFLKEKNPKAKIILADPIGSILYDLYYSGKVIEPAAAYKVEGVGEDMLPQNVHLQYFDEVVKVNDKRSFEVTRELVRKEGICVGPSSGMNLAAALDHSIKNKTVSNYLAVFPDSGRAYLSKAFNEAWLKENNLL